MPSSLPQGVPAPDDTGAWAESISWLRLLLLFAILLAAMAGLFGGGRSDRLAADAPAARLVVDTPQTLRNGNFFETRIEVEARQPISDAVVALPSATWRDVTVNSLIPAASQEEQKDGEYRFHFGPLAPGERLTFKIDGQLNPPLVGRIDGSVRLLDGDRPLVARPVRLTVVP